MPVIDTRTSAGQENAAEERTEEPKAAPALPESSDEELNVEMDIPPGPLTVMGDACPKCGTVHSKVAGHEWEPTFAFVCKKPDCGYRWIHPLVDAANQMGRIISYLTKRFPNEAGKAQAANMAPSDFLIQLMERDRLRRGPGVG